MEEKTQIPENGNIYYASVPEMEADPVIRSIQNGFYGEMEIQVFVSSSASRISEYTARECSDFGTMEIITSDFSASSTEVSHATEGAKLILP